MYQPYPGGYQQPVSQPPGPPPPVKNAVRLMYAGAGVSVIWFIALLTTIGSLKNAFRAADTNLTTSQINHIVGVVVGIEAVFVAIFVGLWLWMAWANRNGKNWARVVATVLFGLFSLLLLLSLVQPHATLSLLITVLTWLAGLGATILLWRRESSAYFQARPAQFR